jgi:hypothetical protein
LIDCFEQFHRECIYINNVTDATREWYECAWKAFQTSRRASEAQPTATSISKSDLQQFVVHYASAACGRLRATPGSAH